MKQAQEFGVSVVNREREGEKGLSKAQVKIKDSREYGLITLYI